jgi:hypothetical protein
MRDTKKIKIMWQMTIHPEWEKRVAKPNISKFYISGR